MRSFGFIGVALLTLVSCGGVSQPAADNAAGAPAAGADALAVRRTPSNACGRSSAAVGVAFGAEFGLPTVPAAEATNDDYDGPAVVEQSSTGGLTLAFAVSSSGSRHVQLSGLGPLPPVAPGAKLWLSTTHAAIASRDGSIPPWALTVRAEQAGTILFGAAREAFEDPASPVRVGERRVTCVASSPIPSCMGTGQVSYQSVEVKGDTPVSIEDGETQTVQLAGRDYDVAVSAAFITYPGFEHQCPAGYDPERIGGAALSVRARDLPSLLLALPEAPPPACGRGNSPWQDLGFFLPEVTRFDGPVFYRESPYGGVLRFDLGGGKTLDILNPPATCATPQAGAEFWLTASVHLAALREKGRGPLVLASAHDLSAPLSAADAAEVRGEIGLPVTAQGGCAYSPNAADPTQPIRLWDVSFGTAPQTIVKTDSQGLLDIAGRSYVVSVSGLGGVSYSIYPR
jgi:hypothetical protein